MAIQQSDWIKYFPFKIPRQEQIASINFILEKFQTGSRFVILEAPLGIGKSAIAITVSKYLHDKTMQDGNRNSYIVTTQKILQEQYVRDFPDIANITAKQNFQCENRATGVTCDMGLTMARILMKNQGTYKSYYNNCCYVRARRNFDDSPIGLTNLAYFLSHASNQSDLQQRHLMVVDECHNVENVVTDFAALTFTKHFVQDILKMPFPNVAKMSIEDFVKWIRNVYSTKLADDYVSLQSKVGSMSSESYLESNSGLASMKKMEDYKRKIENVSQGLKDFVKDEWVMTVSATEDVVSIKPIFASKYTNNMLFRFANKILLMSGTILNKNTFCQNIGIDSNKAEFLSMDSPFPVKNRPVFEVPVGSMGRKSIDATLPKMVATIKELLDHHKNEKGIIHCHNYKIAKYISDNIDSDRLLFHSSDDRIDVLNFHIKTSHPTVIVSPSFTEGIDLQGKLSRFQIIAKIPFPFLGDNYVKEKMTRVKGWYEWQTLKSIIQASGRSVRDYDDHAITYILDSDWLFLKSRNSAMIPSWFKNAIQQ